MNRFIMKKKEDQLKKQIECLEKDLAKLKVEISNLKFTSIKCRPKLSIRNVANQNIPAIPQPELARPEPFLPDVIEINRSRNKLKITNVVLTNFPESCPVCHLHQCEIDFRHTIYLTVFNTLEESLAKLEKKPPDEEAST